MAITLSDAQEYLIQILMCLLPALSRLSLLSTCNLRPACYLFAGLWLVWYSAPGSPSASLDTGTPSDRSSGQVPGSPALRSAPFSLPWHCQPITALFPTSRPSAALRPPLVVALCLPSASCCFPQVVWFFALTRKLSPILFCVPGPIQPYYHLPLINPWRRWRGDPCPSATGARDYAHGTVFTWLFVLFHSASNLLHAISTIVFRLMLRSRFKTFSSHAAKVNEIFIFGLATLLSIVDTFTYCVL